MEEVTAPRPSVIVGLIGIAGIVSFSFAVVALMPVQFNIVSYRTVLPNGWKATMALEYLVPTLFAFVVLAGVAAVATFAAAARSDSTWLTRVSDLWPLAASLPIALYSWKQLASPDAATVIDAATSRPVGPPFAAGLWLMFVCGWAALRVGARYGFEIRGRWANRTAIAAIVVAIAAATWIHARIQINFFEHLMLGHADFGHYAEELHNFVNGHGLRSYSFEHGRFGLHFVPLIFALVPGYLLWPSPVYLFVCGPLFVHVVALPAYLLARRLSGSIVVGLMCGFTWLLLPSVSRLVYSNTYGFQWMYVSMPLIALMILFARSGRWRLSFLFVALVLLTKETAAAATFGWGLYLAVFSLRRKSGVVIAVVSIVYLALCVKVFIPHFSSAERFERLVLYGDLGNSAVELVLAPFTNPGLVFARLTRPEAIYYLIMLIVPMAFLPLRGWKMAVAAVPTLITILLFENGQWLNIKFWHQAPVLTILFFAGIDSMARGPGARGPSALMGFLTGGCRHGRDVTRGLALAALVCAATGHYLFGYSPLAKPFEVYASNSALQSTDPRMDTIRRLGALIPKSAVVHTTERIAAHFTDYERLYTGAKLRPADYVIIDQSDEWDASGLPQAGPRYDANEDYMLYGVFDSIVVFRRISR